MATPKNSWLSSWKEPKTILLLVGIIFLFVVVSFSILRDRIVNDVDSQISVVGRGEVSYQPNLALVSLGVQIDKADSAEKALSDMNDKMGKIISAIEALGIPKENIATKNYSLYPQYDYKNGSSDVSGYTSNQQITIKIEGIDKDPEMSSRVIAEASKAGTNQVLGVNFEVSDIGKLKQEARVLAIKDARSKAGELAKAAGIRRLGKVMSWYENFVNDPTSEQAMYRDGIGSGGSASSVSPQLPSGDQKIVVEMGLQYEVR